MTWGIWGPGLPGGEDTSAHVVRTDYALSQIFANAQIDGWQTSFGLGYQEFLFAGPGFSLAVALVKVLSLGLLSTLDAFKATIVLSFILLPLAVAFMTWAFGLGTRAAGVAAPLTWVVSSGFGGAGLKGVFESGLVPNQLASVFFCLAIGGVALILRGPSTRRVVFTAVAMTLTVITHPIAAYVLAFFIFCILAIAGTEWLRHNWSRVTDAMDRTVDEPDLPVDDDVDTTGSDPDDVAVVRAESELVVALREPRRRLFALAATAVLTFGLSAFLFVPILAHPELKGENSDWGDLPLTHYLNLMWKGEYVFRPGIAVLIVVGWGYLLWRAWRGQRLAATIVLTPILFLIIGRVFINFVPDNIVAIQMTNRGIAYVALIGLLPLAALLASPFRPATATLALLGFRGGGGDGERIANAFLPVFVALLLVVLPPRLGRDQVKNIVPTPTFAALATTLHDIVPPGSRFATQREPARERATTGMPHPDLWLAAVTERDTLNIFNLTSSTVFGPVYEGENLATRPAEQEADVLARLGISHVVLINTDVVPAMLTSPRFHVQWQVGKMAILEVKGPPGQPEPSALITGNAPLRATTRWEGPEHVRIQTDAAQPTAASIAIAWSPKWQITIDGQPVPTLHTADNLLQVSVPAGQHEIALDYGPDRADLIGRTLTVVATGVAIALLVLDRRRRRPATRDEMSADQGADPGPEPDPDADSDPVVASVSRKPTTAGTAAET